MSDRPEAGRPTSIVDVTFYALQQGGKEILKNPQRLLSYLIDMADEGPALTVLELNCDHELLEPLAGVVCGGEIPTMQGIRNAASRMEEILVHDRAVAQQPAHQAVEELCRGVIRYLAERSGAAPRPSQAPVSPSPAPEPAPTPAQPQPTYAHTVTVTPPAPKPEPKPSPEPKPAHPHTTTVTPPAPEPTPKQESKPDPQPTPKPKPKLNPKALATMAAIAFAIAIVVLLNRVTVSFDGGSASGTTGAVKAWRNSEVTLPSSRFSRSGYSFAGWEWDGRTYQPGDTISPGDSVTLYAIWAAVVTFDGNGASSGSVDDILALPGETITLPDLSFERSGYHPIGWDDGSEQFAAGDEVKVDGPVTYSVDWGPRVSFDGNGADKGSVKDVLAEPGETITLPKIGYKRSGYRANGWASGGKLYAAGDKVTVDGPVTYSVDWGAHVSFEGNGPTSGKTSDLYADSSGKVTAPKCGFTYADHVFKGWATSSNGSVRYDPGDTISASSPETLYAVWELDPNIMDKVTIEGVGKNWDDGSHSTMLYVTNNSSTPLKLNASFRFEDASGNELSTEFNNKSYVAPGETTLIYQNCKNGFYTCDYNVTAEEVTNGSGPLYGNVSVEEHSVGAGKIVVRLTNNSNETAYIKSLYFYGEGYYGGSALYPMYPSKSIAPGEHLDIDIVSSIAPENARWNEYYTRRYYLDGYLK